MSSGFWFAPNGRAMFHILDRILDQAYGAPESVLGNRTDPLDEAVYIILSFQTDLARFKETWQRLRFAFPQWEDAERASLDQISEVLRVGGLHRQKSKTIKLLLGSLRQTFGELSLDLLREMTDGDAELALTRLPGLSWKGARCVLLYALGREVFPVDSNTFRIFQRTGVIPRSAIYRRRPLHDDLQTTVPAERRRSFHVNLVVHGQQVCVPLVPKCADCPAIDICPRRGLPALTVPISTSGAREINSPGAMSSMHAVATGRGYRQGTPRTAASLAANMG